MTPTMCQHGPLMADGGDTAERDDPVLVAAAGGGTRLPGVGALRRFRRNRAHGGGVSLVSPSGPSTVQGRVRAVLAGACLMVLLAGCSLDVDTFRESVETHWSGVEKTSPPPSTPASPTPDTSEPAVGEIPPASGPCPRGGSGACRL